MATTYSTPHTFRAGQSLFIATPAYEGTAPGYSYSLALTTANLVRHGIPFELGIMEENCHVDDGRNALVRQFLEGSCTDMLFIDSDLMWSAEDVIKMLTHEDGIVCGAYPKKCTPSAYPIGRIFHTRPNGMLEVSYAPTGFMRIKRSVFEELLPLQSRHGKERPTAVFFERKFNGKTRDGGDVTFCRKWIAYGGKVVVDPHLLLSHIGRTRWAGRFIDYLSTDENRAKHFDESKDPLIDKPRVFDTQSDTRTVPYWIDRIKKGNVSLEVFEFLTNAYGNKPWAATADFQYSAYQMAMNLPENANIFECGCGLSTIVLAATGRKVVVIEEHIEWAEKTQALLDECGLDVEINVAPVKNDWYSPKDKIKNMEVDFLVIDGPRRRHGVSRMWPLANNVLADNGVFLIDDISDLSVPGQWVRCGTDTRPFVAGRFRKEKS